jgi:hypothetical protein
MNDDPRQDPRWLRLHDREWICPNCGLKHAGLFDLALGKPEQWPGPEEYRPNSEARGARNILTEDFCVLDGEHYFVRCVLELPIIGVPEQRFGFGTWSTLSRKNFDIYVETFDTGEQAHLGPWFGWFSNRLLGYPDTLNLKCQVRPRDGRLRPLIGLEPTGHPIANDQADGITFDRILELYALSGHDIGKALSH